MVPQPPHSLNVSPKLNAINLDQVRKYKKKMLQHQTQVLQHHTQNSCKTGNILGINLLMQVDYAEGKV